MSKASFQHSSIRAEWLASRHETALEPNIPVVDAHHHLYERVGLRYLLEEMHQDLRSGHDIRATVYVQGRAMYREDASEELMPVGETEFANGIAAMSASGSYGRPRLCAGIVGYADLMLGDAVRPVLERHMAAAGGLAEEGGRFRGIRRTVAWDEDDSLFNAHAYKTTENMMDSKSFRAGFLHLSKLGLTFDAWLLFPQIPRLTALARAFPETAIVLDHCGGPVRTGRFAGHSDDVFKEWKASLQALSQCPNVCVKLSGMGMHMYGFDWSSRDRAPSSEELANAWRPWIETCIESFGSSRCMYASNFPVDKGSYGYGIGLNAMKRLMNDASIDEKDDVFWRSAARFYRLPDSLFKRADPV
jgi:L-fuconolactonase